MPIPHIPQDLQKGISVSVQTKYGLLKGSRTTNGAAVFLGNTLMSRPCLYLPDHLFIRLVQRFHTPYLPCDSRNLSHFQMIIDTKTNIVFETKRDSYLSCLHWHIVQSPSARQIVINSTTMGKGMVCLYNPHCISKFDMYSTGLGFPPEDLKGSGDPSEDP